MGINRYILLVSRGLYGCQHKELSPEPQDYTLEVPGNFPVPEVMKDNPQTRNGVALGRILFYDKRLSGNNQLSCASCHRQSLAFTDGLALSNKRSIWQNIAPYCTGID